MALNKIEIIEAINERHLATPVLDIAQVGLGSLDVRLGHQFIVFNKATGFRAIDPREGESLREQLEYHHQRILRVGYGEQLFLHPGDFVIARTFEYIWMPSDWLAYVAGRSSWGRLGIIIATATYINPEFKGTITLEITNLGEVPVSLIPLMRIAQLIFHRAGDFDSDSSCVLKRNQDNG
jgi:dCTP deaminase